MSEPGIKAIFSIESVLDEEATKKQGRNVYRDEEWVKLCFADMKTELPKRVDEDVRTRWAEEYEAWKKGVEAPISGTPLREWPQITPAEIASLSQIHIFSLEDLVGVPDSVLDVVPRGLTLKHKAESYLSSAASTGVVSEQMNAMKSDNDELKRQLEEMAGELAALKAEAEEKPKGKKA